MRTYVKLLTICFLFLFSQNAFAQGIENCASCGKTVLTEKQLENKNLEELRLLRNEIYARKGYVFKDAILDNYFNSQKWYKPANKNDEIKLQDIETQNINLLKSLENNIHKKRDNAITDLKKIKEAFKTNNQQVLVKFFGKNITANEVVTLLPSVLNLINLDDIHWYNGKGLYKVTVDNGWGIAVYSIELSEKDIKITYRDDGFSEFNANAQHDPMINEFMFRWLFDINENGISFTGMDGAG